MVQSSTHVKTQKKLTVRKNFQGQNYWRGVDTRQIGVVAQIEKTEHGLAMGDVLPRWNESELVPQCIKGDGPLHRSFQH